MDLVAKIGGFEQGLDKAARTTDKRMREIEKRAKMAGKVIGAALVAAGTAVAVALKGSIDRMDDLSKAAQRANMPTEAFSRLAYASSLADVSMEDLTKSMGKLAKAQGDAAQGLKTQVRGFEALGIAFKNADGSLRSTTDVFLDFADVFQKHKGSPEVMALGMQVFGRSFQNLIPLLKDGSAGLKEMAEEADRLGYTISTEAGQQAEEFNDNLTRLKTAAMGVANAVAADLLPDLLRLTGAMTNTTQEGNKVAEVADKITSFLRTLGTMAEWVANAFNITGTAIATLAAQGVAAWKMMTGEFAEGQRLYAEAAAGLDKAVSDAFADPVEAKVKVNFITGSEGSLAASARKPLSTGGLAITAPSKSGGGKKPKALPDFAKDAADELRKLLEVEEQAREAFASMEAQLAGPLAAAFYQFSVDQERLNEMAQKGAIDTDRLAETHANLRKAYEADVEAIEARLNPGRQLIEDLEFELSLIGLSNDARETAIALRYAEVDAMSAQGKEIEGLIAKKNLELAIERDQIETMDALRDSARGFLDDLSEGVGIWESLKNAADSFADVLFDIASRKLIEQLFGKQGDTGGGGWGDAIGALFSRLWGGGKASGGTVMPGKLYEVGEHDRPEMLMAGGRQYLIPGNAGNVVPMHGGGSGVTQNIAFHLGAPTDTRTQTQIATRAGFEAQRALARNAG